MKTKQNTGIWRGVNGATAQSPYSISAVLANLREFDRQLAAFHANYDSGAGWVRGIARDIVKRGIAEPAVDAYLLTMLETMIKTCNGLADQQAMPDDWYLPNLTAARALVAAVREGAAT